MIQKIRGTKDILSTRLMNFALTEIKKTLKLYHFEEIMTPILEPVALFKRSLGVETDVVSKEMFIVSSSSQESEKEDMIALRPEATASVVRAFVENGIQTVPWKVFLTGPMFRYERPQKGRYREFYQTSLEIIGAHSILHDVQVISMLTHLFKERLQITNYALHLNFLGCPQDRSNHKNELIQFLNEQNNLLCENCIIRKDRNPLRVFDCKNDTCQIIYKKAPILHQYYCATCASEWQIVQDSLEELSISFVVVPHLVRGLDYYNKTVFEFVSSLLGAQAAFCGGGRYDHLVSHIGGKADQPSIGAAIGIDRLLLLLEADEAKLPLSYGAPLCVIIPFDIEQHSLALLLGDVLIKSDITTEILFDSSFKSMLKKADKLGAKWVVFVGSDEQKTGTVKIKEFKTGKESIIKQIELIGFLKNGI